MANFIEKLFRFEKRELDRLSREAEQIMALDEQMSKLTDEELVGKTAEFISKYLRKGNRIGVSGRLRSGSYEKDGQRYYTLEVVATRVDFADSKAAEATEGVAEDMLKNEPKFEYENPFGPLPDEDVLPFD